MDPLTSKQSQILNPLISNNNLWYHADTIHDQHSSSSNELPTFAPKTIHAMSNAASFELWHQCLCHPGRNIMDNIHKHTNVPQLQGNTFWKCPSCMSGKFDKSYHVREKNASKITSWNEKIDDIYLPQAKPGQHFHCDFGFVRSKHYQQKDNDGQTQTSVDGKNSYLLIIDHCTQYTWVYVSSSNLPPIKFCQKVLNKFKSNDEHKTI